MKILITGATGFLGQYVLQKIINKNYFSEIYCISRDIKKSNEVVHWLNGDLNNKMFIETVLQRIKPNVLLHLAWYVNPKDYINAKENEGFYDSSVFLIDKFLEYGGKKILTVGTCFEYDLSYGFLIENKTPLLLDNRYALNKNKLHTHLKNRSRSSDFEYIWARIFYLYGPSESPSRLVPSIINSLLHNEIAKCSKGMQLRDYMYVKDAATILSYLITTENFTGEINLSTGYPVTIREIGNSIENILGVTNKVDFGAFTPRKGEPHLITGEPVLEKLNFNMQLTPLSEGLKETIDWWKIYELSNM